MFTNEPTQYSPRHTLDFEQLKLLCLWIWILLNKKEEIEFMKDIIWITCLIQKNNASKSTTDLHNKLIHLYDCNRPTFWFELLDSVHQGLPLSFIHEFQNQNLINSHENESSLKKLLFQKIIHRSVFPTALWSSTSEGRIIFREGNRIIHCE